MADSYYALTLTATGASTGAYYSLTPTSNLEFTQGGVTFFPSAAAATLVNIYPETLQIQSPAGSVSAGVTLVTSAPEIAGRLLVSPPVDVAVIVTLYGNGGEQLGRAILDPGVGDQVFSFPVSDSQAIPREQLAGIIRGLVPPATP